MNQDLFHVLLIADDEEVFLLARDLLEQVPSRQITLEWAPTFAEGLQGVMQARSAAGRAIDCVLADDELDCHTGLDLIRQARQSGAALPFILFTDRAPAGLLEQALQAGADVPAADFPGADFPGAAFRGAVETLSKTSLTPQLLERTIRFTIENQRLAAELQRTEQQARDLLRYAPTAIYEIDMQTRKFKNVNDVMCAYLGYSRQELLQMDSESLLSENSRRLFQERIRRTLAGEQVDESVEYRVRAKDGRELYAVLNATLTYKDGLPYSAMVIAHDVTERRKVERALKAQNERLKVYADQLHRSNQLLADFAFNASHDLQEPLRKIQAFGELLAESSACALDDLSRDYITRMQSAARRMRDLLNGLLNYARIANQENPFTRIDLNEIAAGVLEDLEILVENTGGRVTLGRLPTLEADPIQMRELFQNLIGNALKYHRPGVPPQVSITSEDAAGEMATIVVADNGIGIEAPHLEAIFLPFRRLHPRKDVEGAGMGLAISRSIVERHAGSLTVESTPGQGAAFRIVLPFTQTA